MKKAVILFVLPLLFLSNIHAQKVLHSEKDMITIRFNEFDVAWHLTPELNPDVFTVGATFNTKNIRVVTEKDSVSYVVHPGEQIPLIVYLNNVACHILIDAMNEPLLLHPLAGILVLVLTILILWIAGRAKGTRLIRSLLTIGAFAPVLFWIVTITAGWIHGNYNHLDNAVSELGTIGTRSEYLMAIATFLIGLLAAIFSIGFYKASKALHIATLPPILSFAMAISLIWAAVFPSGHELHGKLGPLPLIMMIGTLVSVIAWPKQPAYKSLRIISGIALLIMCLFFFKFVPNTLQGFEGMLQRFMYTGWTVWYLAVARTLRAQLQKP